MREPLHSGYGMLLMRDHQAIIPPLLYFDPAMAVAGALQCKQELEGFPSKGYGVIGCHNFLFAGLPTA